jgi:hypothetical protein
VLVPRPLNADDPLSAPLARGVAVPAGH